MEKMPFEETLRKSGYSKKNLYTRENRTPIKITKIIEKDWANEWSGRDVEEIIYVTKCYAEKIPNNIVIALNCEDERFLLKTDKDLNDIEKRLLVSYKPGLEKYDLIPHILFKKELREGLNYIYK
jgi:hypothetical protein